MDIHGAQGYLSVLRSGAQALRETIDRLGDSPAPIGAGGIPELVGALPKIDNSLTAIGRQTSAKLDIPAGQKGAWHENLTGTLAAWGEGKHVIYNGDRYVPTSKLVQTLRGIENIDSLLTSGTLAHTNAFSIPTNPRLHAALAR